MVSDTEKTLYPGLLLAESKADFKNNVGGCCILIIVRFYFLFLEQLTFRRSTANSRVDGEY